MRICFHISDDFSDVQIMSDGVNVLGTTGGICLKSPANITHLFIKLLSASNDISNISSM